MTTRYSLWPPMRLSFVHVSLAIHVSSCFVPITPLRCSHHLMYLVWQCLMSVIESAAVPIELISTLCLVYHVADGVSFWPPPQPMTHPYRWITFFTLVVWPIATIYVKELTVALSIHFLYELCWVRVYKKWTHTCMRQCDLSTSYLSSAAAFNMPSNCTSNSHRPICLMTWHPLQSC